MSDQTRGIAFLPNLGVYQEAEPECLQDPEDETFDPVQEAQAKEIAICKQAERPHKQGSWLYLWRRNRLRWGGLPSASGWNASGGFLGVQLGHLAIGPAVMAFGPSVSGMRMSSTIFTLQLAAGSPF